MNSDVKDTILIGDQTVLSFKAKVPKGAKYIFPVPQNPITQGVEIIGKPVTDTLSVSGGEMELETRITLSSFDSGSYTIPPIPAYMQKADGSVDTIWYDGGKLEVKTIQIDTTTFKPYDIKGQLNYPYTVDEFLPWAGLLAVLIALGYFIRRLIKSRREKRSLFKKPVIQDPPHIVALKTLEAINARKLWQNKQEKLYYTEIVDTLRIYLEGRFNIATMEKTTGEILESLSSGKIDPKELNNLKELLYLADFVKFAKYKPSTEDNENAIPGAVRFVNATSPQDTAEEKGR